MSDEASTADALGDAVARVLADRGQIPTRWLVLVEVIDADGGRGIWYEHPEDMRQWESLGLLEYGKALEAAKVRYDHRDEA